MRQPLGLTGGGVGDAARADAPGTASGPALAEAAHDALTLKYLDGGHSQGCSEEADRFTRERRAVHHATFYGFLLCFASTSVATVCRYTFGRVVPYAWTSPPKLLGGVGGVLLVLGCAGLLRLCLKRHRDHQRMEQRLETCPVKMHSTHWVPCMSGGPVNRTVASAR